LRQQGDDPFANLERQGYFGKRAVAPCNGNEHLGGVDDDRVSGMPHVGGDGNVDMRVGFADIRSRQDADRTAAAFLGSPRGGGHHPPQSAADEDSMMAGDFASHLEGQGRRR